MSRELAVWMFSGKAGTLSSENGHLLFQYSSSWLNHASSVPLSCSLPLQTEPFPDARCRPFFAGLLPEGHLRQQIARQCHVSGQNDFALLQTLGGECAGAITFLPPGVPVPEAGQGYVDWLDEAGLQGVLEELPHRPMLAGYDGLRLSLAGAQDKLPVVCDGHRIGMPRNGYPSTHILKPMIPAVENSVLNEAFCLALARSVGLSAAEGQMITTARGSSVLLVTRYDREGRDQPVRLHQEDFCQALGVLPEMKYQNEGGPSLQDCFALLRRVTRPGAPQTLRFLDAVVFNALAGNHDAHAKNFALLYTNGVGGELAPLYDVLCTAVYEHLTPKMAMKLGGKYTFADVYSRHWDEFYEEAGLSKAQTRRRILHLAHHIPVAAQQLARTPPFAGQKITERIADLVRQRSTLTVQRLGGQP